MISDPDHSGMIIHRFVLIQRKTLFRGLLRPANDATGSDWVHVAPDWIHVPPDWIHVPPDWIHVPNDTNLRGLEREFFAAGWKFFYGATTIRAIGFGFDRPMKFGD
jgi:hypothetical protein